MTPDQRYATSDAFQAAVKDRLKVAAQSSPRSATELRRQFVIHRLLARVFDDPASPWVLKGGTGLLIRLPGARHSKDLDLLHPVQELREAHAELRELAQLDLRDHLTWDIGDAVAMGTTARIMVTASAGARQFETFSIDLSTTPRFIAALERQRPTPILDMPGIPPLPEFTLYPLPDQVADKVCAMYERHNGVPSTRYRDLVDLVLITNEFSLASDVTSAAIRSEERRREMTLPQELIEPDPRWAIGGAYRVIASKSTLPAHQHGLTTALSSAGQCLNPLLAGAVTEGQWHPARRVWE